MLRRPRAAFAQVRPRRGRLGANSDSPLADEFVATDPRIDAPPRFEDADEGGLRSNASSSEPSRETTAAYVESDWNWVTMNEKAATSVVNAIADWVITPNSTSPRMNTGAMITTGMS